MSPSVPLPPRYPFEVSSDAAMAEMDAARFRVLRALLDAGGVVAIPTESSYGLAADPRSPEGVAAIYRWKGRAAGKALAVVAADLGQLVALGVDPEASRLDALAGLWPGAVSVVVTLAAGVSLPAAAPDGTLAVRIPGDPGLRRWLAALGRAVTATSANASGEAPALSAAEAEELLARGGAPGLFVVVDGGRLPGGPPSTLIRVRGDGRGEDGIEVLRPGAMPLAEVRRRLAGGGKGGRGAGSR